MCYLIMVCRKCAEGVGEAQGSTMAIEFILNSPGEWDVLPKSGQVLSKKDRSSPKVDRSSPKVDRSPLSQTFTRICERQKMN